MNLEKLKLVDLFTLDTNSVEEHVNRILSLSFDEAVEYLEYAIDKFYKIGENSNDKVVEIFFNTDKFGEHYEVIYNKNEE